jgi:hypothetical protein
MIGEVKFFKSEILYHNWIILTRTTYEYSKKAAQDSRIEGKLRQGKWGQRFYCLLKGKGI